MAADGTLRKSITTIDWEDIEVKPPIDLIPDEFERDTNKGFLVMAVNDKEDIEANEFSGYLKELEFEVKRTDLNEYCMFDSVNLEWLQKVKDDIDKNDYSGILMVFAKVIYTAKDLRTVWAEFTSKKCPKLKNKPKIFIFQVKSKRVQRDSTAMQLNWKSSYETPSEADILIIQDQYSPQRDGLLSQLRSAINEYGDKEDIFTLTTINQKDISYQPMVISTMTRKFYFKPHPHRGYHLDIHNNSNRIKKHVEKITQQAAELKNGDRKPKNRDGFMGFLRKSFTSKKSLEKRNEGSVAGGGDAKPMEVASGAVKKLPVTENSGADKNRIRRTSTEKVQENKGKKEVGKPAWKN